MKNQNYKALIKNKEQYSLYVLNLLKEFGDVRSNAAGTYDCVFNIVVEDNVNEDDNSYTYFFTISLKDEYIKVLKIVDSSFEFEDLYNLWFDPTNIDTDDLTAIEYFLYAVKKCLDEHASLKTRLMKIESKLTESDIKFLKSVYNN